MRLLRKLPKSDGITYLQERTRYCVTQFNNNLIIVGSLSEGHRGFLLKKKKKWWIYGISLTSIDAINNADGTPLITYPQVHASWHDCDNYYSTHAYMGTEDGLADIWTSFHKQKEFEFVTMLKCCPREFLDTFICRHSLKHVM